MTKRIHYNQILDRISLILQELYKIIESIKLDFENENKQDPGLTKSIVENTLNIIRKYKELYENRVETDWSLDKDLNYTKQNIRSFNREFDNPFLGSKKWYQRIKDLQEQLSEQSRELDKLIETK